MSIIPESQSVMIDRYAEILVTHAVSLRPGQDVFIRGQESLHEFGLRVGEAAYEHVLEIHRRIRTHPRDHGLSAEEVDRYFRRVGNGDPVVLISSKRVPTEQAEHVAEQLAKLAQASVQGDDGIH